MLQLMYVHTLQHTHGDKKVEEVDIEGGLPDSGQSVTESLERTDPEPIRRSQLGVLGERENEHLTITTSHLLGSYILLKHKHFSM